MTDKRGTRVGGYYVGLVPGKKIPSVTTVLGRMLRKDGLEYWKKKNNNWRELQEKARISGTLMHHRILGRIADAPLELQEGMGEIEWTKELLEEMREREKQWKSLCIEPMRPRQVEHTAWMDGEYPAAGTMDYNGKLKIYGMDIGYAVMDLKSSAKPQKGHEIQIGAYALMLKEMGIQVDCGVIPYVRRNSAEMVMMEKEELEDRGAIFLDLTRRFYLGSK
jgi:CRISPR/Cas system-associated exonuclease Cas4 (RecB family)